MDGLFATPDADHTRRYARVVVERGIDRGGGAGDEAAEGFTYAITPGESPAVGERVEVPLGRGNAKAAGIVVALGGHDLLAGLDPDRVKPISRCTGARLAPALVELARWISAYYVAPLGMVLSAMLPAAVKHGIGAATRTVIEFADLEPAARDAALAGLKPALADVWRRISQGDVALPMPAKHLAKAIDLRGPAPIRRLIDAGLLREAEQRGVRVRTTLATTSPEGAGARTAGLAVTPAQSAVIDGVTATLGAFGVHLVRGVTGSGKTEVYLRIIRSVLDRGKSAIVLVPEIALTPQTAGRFVERFPDEGVAVLHSGLTSAQRHREWARAGSGAARVVVGARSAVFAPVADLGLIVVDEEHDGGYKQDQLPRYHGRDVAIKRAHLEGCPVLLGSATPALETWANATGAAGPAKYRLWELTERVGGGRLPEVRIVDLAADRRERYRRDPKDRHFHLLGLELEDALERTLSAGGQAILLLNRRGFANHLACVNRSCGWVLTCDDCEATMVLHRGRSLPTGELVRCHHCLAEKLVPRACPLCGSAVNAFGQGTQRVEAELERKLGAIGIREGSTLLRIDSDTMSTGRDFFAALDRFASGEVKILLGTQMIAKGLDFPNVRLVGVVNADTGLTIPDIRDGERTFQLISQVAGRAGRGSEPGLVIVQTFSPHVPAIRLAAEHDYVSFAELELALRKPRRLPPFSRMARIVVRDEDMHAARSHAAELAELLREAGRERVLVEGPMECAVARVAGFWRFAIDLAAAGPADLHAPLEELRTRGLLKSDARVAVDVDPIVLA